MDFSKVLPRDAFVNTIYDEAIKNKNVYFLSADLGAEALDKFRDNLKGQFIHAGISEQNMVDIAAALAMRGKIVYVYAMVPFITLRCFEQIKVALATMNMPVTVLGIGAGYSYDDAGPTHYGTEDVSCMRSLGNIEILAPSDTQSVLEAARLTLTKPFFRYVRLDRKNLPAVYGAGETRFLDEGICEIDRGEGICILTSGYMIQKAREVRDKLAKEGLNIGVADIFKIKPLNARSLKSIAGRYRQFVTLEEHFLSGGLGSAVAETLSDHDIKIPLKRIGIADTYRYENGGREHLHKLCKIDVQSVIDAVKSLKIAPAEAAQSLSS